MAIGLWRSRLFFVMSAMIHLIVVVIFLWAYRSSEVSLDLLNPLTEFSLVSSSGHPGKAKAGGETESHSSAQDAETPAAHRNSTMHPLTGETSSSIGESEQADGPVGVEQLLEKPRVLKEVKAIYPMAAKQKGIEGVVKLQVVVSRVGKVDSAEVLEGPDFELNQAAQAALMQFEFTPAQTKDGPRRFQLIYKYNFKLDTQ